MHPRSRRFRHALALAGALTCGALLVGGVSPTWADDGASAASGPSEAPVLGGFALGDAIEGMIDERDGAFTVSLPAGGLMLAWDSRGVGGEGASGLPAGWGFGLARVLTEGGVRVAPASGGLYELDVSHPSGLAGYGLHDLRFEDVSSGVLPAREGGAVGERAYRFRLSELGGVVTTFDEAGRPVARVGATGERTDWLHDDDGRLVQVIDAEGVVTELDWDSEPGVLLVRPAANVPAANLIGDAAGRVWRVELDSEQVVAVADPLGGRLEVGSRDGLVNRLSGVSGSVTEVEWQRFDDGVPRIERVRVVDGSGVEVSTRTLSRVGAASSSGWPGSTSVSGPFGLQDPAFGYETELSDGATKVRSTYTGLHLLQRRDTVVTTAAGEVGLQEQTFEYPEIPGGVFDPRQLPGNWSRPAQVEVTSHGATGASRSVATTSTFDQLGRQVEQTAPDGTVTRTDYDAVIPGEDPEQRGLPIGLPVKQTVTASDGSVQEVEHRLNAERTAVLETETRSRVPGHELTTTGLTQFTVEPDGFVSEQRVYPGGDRASLPSVTAWNEVTDQSAGTVTGSQTVGVGTPGEATTTQTGSMVHGGVIAQTDAAGNTSTATYDVLGRPVEQADASGLATRTSYDRAAHDGRNATTVTTPDGVATTEVRDSVGRVVQTLDNIDRGAPVVGHVRVAEKRSYPAAGTVVVTDAWGATTTVRQDVFGREVETTAANGLSKRTVYDDVANTVTSGLTPTGDLADSEIVRTAQLDDGGRAVGAFGTRADGEPVPESATTYDGLGRELIATDGMLRSAVEYDALGNPGRRTLTVEGVAGMGAGSTGAGAAQAGAAELDENAPLLIAERRFDASGNSVEKTLSDGRHSRSGGAQVIDAFGQPTSTTDQADRTGTIEYSPDGLPIREVTGSGRVIETEYDERTRQPVSTTTTSPAGETVMTEVDYDDLTGRVAAVFDPADRAGTEIRYRYDAFGNTTSIRYPDGSTIGHTYDAHGRKTETIDATGAATRYAYDATGLMTSATQVRDDAGDAPALASVSYTYDDYGRVVRLDRDTGAATAYSFTSAGEIESETTTGTSGATLSARDYTYDPAGNLVERIDRVSDDEGQLIATTTSYRYDAMRQLTGSTVRQGEGPQATVSRTTEYELRVTGDIERETLTDRPGAADERVVDRKFEYSPLGELLAITTNGERRAQNYDAAGNLVGAADGTTYSYDAANRPVATTTPDGVTTGFEYWADGTRRSIERDDPATGTHSSIELLWDGATLVNERHAGDGMTGPTESGVASYLIGATRHARITRTTGTDGADGALSAVSTSAHLITDRHGNLAEVIDDAGRISERNTYGDYGTESGSSTAGPAPEGLGRNPFRYAGEFTDVDGSQFLTERLYLPGIMRFASDDPAPEHNDYAYGHLNPITMVDPSGRTPTLDAFAGWVLAGVGAVTAVASIIGAVVTGGGSMSLLGVAGWMLEGGALAATAMTVADQFTPFLSPDQRLALNVTEMVLGGVSSVTGWFGFADYGRAAASVKGAADNVTSMFTHSRFMWLPHINATPFTHGINLVLAERKVLADDLIRYGVRPLANAPASITTNLSTAENSLHAAYRNSGGQGVKNVALAQAFFRNKVTHYQDRMKRRVLTRSVMWQAEYAQIQKYEGEVADYLAQLKAANPAEFAFLDQLKTVKGLITDLVPKIPPTNASMLQNIDSNLVPTFAAEPQRLVTLEHQAQ